jgi:protein-tyrosine phosphatase
MIDLHSHILPGVDDGPATLDQAVAMLQLAAANGTTDIVATPHANSEYALPDSIDDGIRRLESACGGVLRVHHGCEFHLNAPNILDALIHPARYTINGKGYLLVEFPELVIPPAIEGIFSQFRTLGITPVVTHPERNMILQRQATRLESWVAGGCHLQLTAQSLLGRFGPVAERCAIQLLERGLVHFVASDGHDVAARPPVLAGAWAWLLSHYVRRAAESLLTTNPSAAITGEPLQVTVQ